MAAVTVATSAGLTAALKAAHSGDTILLKAGTYSGLQFRDLSFADNVTITSLDTAHRAVLTNFSVLRVDGLTFSNVEMNAVGSGFGFNISKSQNINFDHDFIHGSLDGNAQNDGAGLGFLDSSNIAITNSEFTELRQAAGIGTDATKSISNIYVAGNEVHGVAKSGFVFAGASNVTVTKNTISDIRPVAGDHPDAIQFFTTGTKVAAHDIVVSDNVIVRGDGEATQGIFFRDQTGKLPFEHVSIDNNLVVGTGYGGIYVMGAKNLEISGNTLVSNPGASNNTFLLVQGADGVVARNNQAQTISFDHVTNLSQAGNHVNGAVTDDGQAAMHAWALSHPGAAYMLAPFMDGGAPAQPPLTVPGRPGNPGDVYHAVQLSDPHEAMDPIGHALQGVGWHTGNLLLL